MNQITSLSQLKKIKFNQDDSVDSNKDLHLNKGKELYSPQMQIIIKSKSPNKQSPTMKNSELREEDEEIMEMEEMPL